MDEYRVTFEPDDLGFVHAVARGILRDSADVDDVAQDALLLAYRHRDAFRGDARYHTWLHRIATMAALGHLRRARRCPVANEADVRALERVADPAKSPDALVEETEERAALERALVELAPGYRDVLLAHADATAPEVARELGLSVANVKVRAHRARKQLREALVRMDVAV